MKVPSFFHIDNPYNVFELYLEMANTRLLTTAGALLEVALSAGTIP